MGVIAKMGQVVTAGFEQLVKIDVNVDQAVKDLHARAKRDIVRLSKVQVPSFSFLSRYDIPFND